MSLSLLDRISSIVENRDSSTILDGEDAASIGTRSPTASTNDLMLPKIGSELKLLRHPSQQEFGIPVVVGVFNAKSKRHMSLANAFGLDRMHNSPKSSKSKNVSIVESDSDEDDDGGGGVYS